MNLVVNELSLLFAFALEVDEEDGVEEAEEVEVEVEEEDSEVVGGVEMSAKALTTHCTDPRKNRARNNEKNCVEKRVLSTAGTFAHAVISSEIMSM
jgi:hypothetical protein